MIIRQISGYAVRARMIEIMHKRYGFTIVELLIVIVVIGILATIAVVAFGAVRSRAVEATVSSDMRNNIVRVKSYMVEFGKLPTREELEASTPHNLHETNSTHRTTDWVYCHINRSGQAVRGLLTIGTRTGKYFAANTEDGGVRDITQAATAITPFTWSTPCASQLGSGESVGYAVGYYAIRQP